MSFFNRFIRPKIKNSDSISKGDGLWVACRGCSKMILKKDFIERYNVCGICQYHEKISPSERFAMIFDSSEYSYIDLPQISDDPIKFQDVKKYQDRLNDARIKTNSHEAVQFAIGNIDAKKAIVGVIDFGFIGGSLGIFMGESIVTASMRAIADSVPMILIIASGGARMQEGIMSLMQMPRTVIAVKKLKESGIPYIAILTNPTTGGVSASFGMLGDITIAEPGAIIGFAGARVIRETIGENPPADFQTSEFQLNHGFIDKIVHRNAIKDELGKLLRVFSAKREL